MSEESEMTVPNEGDQGAVAGKATAPELVAHLIASIRAPEEPLERLRFATMADDLSRLDGAAAAALIDQPLDRDGGAYGQLACYVLGTLAVAGIAAQGIHLEGRDGLLHVIRQQIRSELVRIPAQLPAVWMIPASVDDGTATYVAALLMLNRGDIAKPWLWSGIPEHGRFHIIGARTAIHPAVDDPRCAGALDLMRFVHQQRASLSAADQPIDMLAG